MQSQWRMLASLAVLLSAETYSPPDTGLSAGLIPDCPGVEKNASISPASLRQFSVVLQRLAGGQVRRRALVVHSAAKALRTDKHFDMKRRKTVVYAVGFLDSSAYPHSQAIANSYVRRGYNVFITDTLYFLSYIYPKSVRLARALGWKLGEFLVQLHAQGLDPGDLELVGASLGAHLVSFAAKYFYTATGKKPSRLTGLDPAGPCYRSVPPDSKFAVSDATRVDVLHTNIDGFGIAERLGHVDFYVNGGEFQPGDIPYVPCLVVCSHVRAMLYWWIALEHPKQFIALKCESIQAARLADCYNTTDTNYMGLETRFDKPGVYYLPTHNEFPYYRAKEGLKKDNEIYTSVVRDINAGEFGV